MNRMRYTVRGVSGGVLMSLTMMGLQTPAYAGMVGTGAVINQQQSMLDRGQIWQLF